jgi:hypothetical protein
MLFKNYFVIIFLLTLCISCNSQQTVDSNQLQNTDILRNFTKDSLKHLLPILDSVFNTDTIKKYKEQIRHLDSINLLKIIPIIEKYGVLGYRDVGFIGNMAIVMTIQHADISVQEKYLPLFRFAIKEKRILPSNYAMLEDWVAIKNKRMQTYGTQVLKYGKRKVELLPTIDVDNINKRRYSIGMTESIEVYLKRFGYIWNAEEYKKQLPELMKKHNIKE